LFLSRYNISPKEAEVDNLFARLGFFTRSHIQIFPSDFKTNASDIDVLAIRFNPYLIPEFNVIEVKEGRSKVTKLFQLYGFKSYFGNCNAYYVAEEIYDTVIEVSKKLGIRTLSHSRLMTLVHQELKRAERRKRIFVDLDVGHLEKIMDYLSIIKKFDEELFWKYHYLWLEKNPYKKFYQLQRLFRKTRDVDTHKGSTGEAIAWYKREIFSLSLVTAALMAYDCIDLRSEDLFSYVENKFYNVGTSKEGKLKVQEGISTLTEQIEKISQGLIKVPKVEIVPSYVEDLVRLLNILIMDAPYVQSYLLINNNIHRTNLRGESKNLNEFTSAEIQYKRLVELNGLLLKVLYEGGPAEVVFNDFV